MTSSDRDDDAEQRIQRAMDSIFSSSAIQAASSCSSSPPARSRDAAILERRSFAAPVIDAGEKKIGETNAGEVASTSAAPSCRPWDREDLLRRLGTFKSAKWFGKPSTAGPVACARRGWINVDLDLIACEVCGSRLSFSVPATLTKKQVEAAGIDFSKRLDEGHKLSCPWKANGCAEELAAFPPAPAPVLVQGYEERLQSLSSLSALPVVSSSAVEHMKISRADQVTSFLARSSNEAGIQELEAAHGEAVQELRRKYEQFLQAQKIISLCGWEIRQLPYAVDTDSRELRVSLGSGSDPCSTVFECRLCRSSVGLWKFSTLSRSSLDIKAILSTIEASTKKSVDLPPDEVNASDDAAAAEKNGDVNAEIAINDNNTSLVDDTKQKPGLDLSLTIAGGPRPTRLVAPSPASIPIPGLGGQQQHDFQSRKSTGQTKKTTAKSGSKRKVDADPKHRKKLKTAVDGVPGSSSVNAVETSYNHNRHENSAESVECSPQGSDDEEQVSRDKSAKQQQHTAGATILQGDPSEFDPVRGHRYFCPWISSNAADHPGKCGWQLTLDAVASDRDKMLSVSAAVAAAPAAPAASAAAAAAAAVNKMDPLVSVRKMLGGKGKGVAVHGAT